MHTYKCETMLFMPIYHSKSNNKKLLNEVTNNG